MKKKKNEFFGKFQKNKIKAIWAIKGGALSGETKTTLCETLDGTFDSDPNSGSEDRDGGRGCP